MEWTLDSGSCPEEVSASRAKRVASYHFVLHYFVVLRYFVVSQHFGEQLYGKRKTVRVPRDRFDRFEKLEKGRQEGRQGG